jgi:hypothetical protein
MPYSLQRDLRGKHPLNTFPFLVSSDNTGSLYDGTGSQITNVNVTASFSVSASYEILYESSSSFADFAASASVAVSSSWASASRSSSYSNFAASTVTPTNYPVPFGFQYAGFNVIYNTASISTNGEEYSGELEIRGSSYGSNHAGKLSFINNTAINPDPIHATFICGNYGDFSISIPNGPLNIQATGSDGTTIQKAQFTNNYISQSVPLSGSYVTTDGAASASPEISGTIMFELEDDTTLNIVVRCRDGVVRRGTLLLL